MKKFLMGFISLALVLTVVLGFAACGKGAKELEGKTFELRDVKVTLATYKVDADNNFVLDDDGNRIIEKTETLGYREALEKSFLSDKAEDYVLTDEDKEFLDEAYNEMIKKFYNTEDIKDENYFAENGVYPEARKSTVAFKNGKVTILDYTETKTAFGKNVTEVKKSYGSYSLENGVITTELMSLYYSSVQSYGSSNTSILSEDGKQILMPSEPKNVGIYPAIGNATAKVVCTGLWHVYTLVD